MAHIDLGRYPYSWIICISICVHPCLQIIPQTDTKCLQNNLMIYIDRREQGGPTSIETLVDKGIPFYQEMQPLRSKKIA